MRRLTDLNEIMFPVDEHPVFACVETDAGEQRLPVPEKKAIVNRANGRVLGIVRRGYRLVSNREVLEMAHKCCRAVFPETRPVEWRVTAVDAPMTGGHCFIDFTHNSAALDFSFLPAADRPDEYGPFIRVTNSYNGLRALNFDIGYHRKVCTNGLILPGTIISFRFSHLRREIRETIKFEVTREKLTGMRESFGEYLHVLREFDVSRPQFEPLVFAVLLLREPGNAKPDSKEAEAWAALRGHLKRMCDRYADELGENAYAAFNVITDFASHPPDNRCVYRDRHSFQRLAGEWLNQFNRECRKPDFDLGKHIDEIKKGRVYGSKLRALEQHRNG